MQTSLALKARQGRIAALEALRVIKDGETEEVRKLRRVQQPRRVTLTAHQVVFKRTAMGFYGQNKLAA